MIKVLCGENMGANMTQKRRAFVWLFAWLATWSMAVAQKPNLDAILNRRQDVYIAGFFPFGKGVEHAGTGRGVMPSVKLALDHVNEHESILRNYRLHMWWNDTECNAAVGVKSFFDMMHSGPNKLMLFGAACTHVTDPIAKASKRWLLTQLSYADTHPMFTKESFPNFFRVVPSENAFNLPRLALLTHFNWTRVGTIYQNEPRYALAHNRLVADLDEHGFEVVETQSFAGDARAALERLKEKDVRIILGNFNETWAAHVFCEAYRLDMYGRAYQWLIQGAYSDRWWRRRTVCPRQHLARALDTVILTDLLPLSTSGDITISGITAKEYQVEYDRRRGSEYSRFHGYTYDGIWAVALAIQTVAARARQVWRREVLDFQYRDRFWEELFLSALHNVSFEGVTGPVRFYDNERKASILLKQFQGEVSGEVKVGEYCAELARLDFSTGTGFRWTGRFPPKDRTLLRIEHTQVNITIYAVLASCSVLGIMLATGFLAMNIRYRNQRYIKMSSPHLNNLIIVGCILTYTSVIFLGLDSGLSSIASFPYICTARAWLLMAGFSLAFGAMFSKTWRVHSIFTDLKLNKKVIKDYQLFMVVGVLISVDMIIMVTWQVADPFYRATKQMEPYPDPSSEDILIIRENEYCQSERMNIFIGIIYAYKGLLLVFGAFLAWETRHVSIPALNDSKHVGLSVYNVLIMCIMGAAIALVLTDHKDALFVLISIFIIFCTTGTLCLVFVPKLLELRRNGQPGAAGSDKARIRATLRPASKGHDSRSPGPEMERRLKELRSNNTKFRRTLQAKENELQLLLGKLGSDVAGGVAVAGTKTPPGRLVVPIKEQPSLPETSDITSLCSLSQSQGADTDYYNIQEKAKPTPSAPPASEVTIDRKERERREPSAVKNVSFKNHVNAPPKPAVGIGVRDADTPPPPYKNHADSNGAAPRAVPEKDQLAKLPYGWSVEEPSNKYQPLKPSTNATPEYPPTAQRLSEAKPSAPHLEHQVYQQQQPIQQPLQQSQQIIQPIYQQMQPIHQMVQPIHQSVQPIHQHVQQSRARHRRTSSIGQAALISDLMSSSTDADEQVTRAPLTERKVIGAEREDLKPSVPTSNATLRKQAAVEPDVEPPISTDRERRKSICRRDSQKRKSNFIVVQSDLWDTNTFSYTSPKPSTPTASRDHTPMQRSVSEKNQRHHGASASHREDEPRMQSTERRSSNGGLCVAVAGEGGIHHGHGSPRAAGPAPVTGGASGTSEGRSSRGATPDGYRDADTLRMQDRGHKRRGSELPTPAQTTTPTRQQRRRQSSAQIRDPDSSPPSSPSALSVAHQVKPSPTAKVPAAAVVPLSISTAFSTAAHPSNTAPRRHAHHQSTPDVMAMMRKQKKASSSPERKRCDPCLGHEQIVQHSTPDELVKHKSQDKHDTGKLYSASSESELFECAILPIFQKLLTERHKSQPHGLNLSYGVSCPNISIKCDIVEYL